METTELWDCYDIDRNLTGRVMKRSEPIADGDYHLVVHACVFNSEGRMLIQKRADTKIGWPGMWDVTMGGSAVAGETSRMAAKRELAEEVGLDLDFSGVKPGLSINYSRNFDDFFILRHDCRAESLKLQEEEVSEARWASKEEIHRMIDDGTFIPYFHSIIDAVFGLDLNENGIDYGKSGK